MPARSGNKPVASSPGSRLSELGIVLPTAPTPLGSYVESSEAGNLLFLSGTLPMINRRLAFSGRLGENLTVKEGQEVKAGETVAVVEAMKMENVLRAEIDGTVKKINCKPGDSLAVDAVILEFA